MPFCRQCNAPQIRVAVTEAIAPAEMIPEGFSPRYSAAPPSASFSWPQALRAAALAGLLGIILMYILRQAFAVAMITSGFLSVYFYRRKNPFSRLTAATGALLGALSGVFGTLLLTVACSFVIFSVRSRGENHDAVMAALQQQMSRNPDPHAQQVLEYMKTPEGFTLIVVVLLVAMLIFFLILASLGGAIAAALTRRKQRM